MRTKRSITLALAAFFTVGAMVLGMASVFTVGIKAEENTMTSGNIHIVQKELQRKEGVGHIGNLSDGDLVPAVQGQPLYPAHPNNSKPNPYTAEQTDLLYWGSYVTDSGAGNGLWDDEKLRGVMDNFVFVENIGAFSCYYRTWIALECPEGMEFSASADKQLTMNVNAHPSFEWSELGYEYIDGQRYYVMVATYKKALSSGEKSRPSLLQVVMTHNATTEQVEKLGNTYDILTFTQACQTGIFTSDEKAANALAECFGGVPSLANHPWANADFGEFAWDFKTLERAVNSENTKFTATLVEDITLSGNLFDRSVNVSYDATINLNNHNLSANNGCKINAAGHKLTFIGNGNVDLDRSNIIADELVIKGGTWSFDPIEFVPQGYAVTDNNTVIDVSSIVAPNASQIIEALTKLPSTQEESQTDIKTKISKIIFGKTSDYISIINDPNTIKGSEENGATTYYVADGSNYIVYMLSDEKIYAPVDSSSMFRDMTNLTEVDLSNLDMSTATSTKYMFRECNNLTSIGDVSGWNLSNVTSARGMFYNCSKLDGVDVSDWDVSNIEDAGWMFYNCSNITELDVSNWDTSSFTFTKSMFYNSTKLTELDVSNWDMSDVTDVSYMFSYCTALGNVDLSKWDVSNVQYFNNMFKHARAMDTLDLSTWDTSSAIDMNHMFANCGKLKNLDISGFDTSNVTTMGWMFYEIEVQNIYIGDKWSLESIINLDEGVYSHKIATATLVGGQGTTCQQIMDLDSKCVAENGARINATARYMIADGGASNPGLLTYKTK